MASRPDDHSRLRPGLRRRGPAREPWRDQGLLMAAPSGTRPHNTATHVIVTCTDRKALPVPAHLRLAAVPAGPDSYRARTWISRLSAGTGLPAAAARDLYGGEHWQVARAMTGMAKAGEQVRLWACSAGYGLIPAAAVIHPYAATFTPGHPDSTPRGDGAARWWRALGEWDGPAPGQPRSLRDLVSGDPGATFLLALSPAYARACQADIAAARERARDPDRIILVSAGIRSQGSLASVMVPADARLQACLGGTRQALNARIAAHLLEAGIRSRSDAAGYLAGLLLRQPPVPRYDRARLTDQEVLGLITDRLGRPPATAASRMLRQLRDAGYACEQQRFSQLYRRATGLLP